MDARFRVNFKEKEFRNQSENCLDINYISCCKGPQLPLGLV